MTGFWTLLGPDYAGKSTVLARLRDGYGWRIVSHDDGYLDRYPLIALLRRRWIDDALVWTGSRYTPELVLSVMHTVILHQRDMLARLAGTDPVVVDSFYYKQLAACALLGVGHQPTFEYWRTFPRPSGVVYLDVPPEVAWERAGNGAEVTRYECYGDGVSRGGFLAMQADLREYMLREVADLPVTVVDGTASREAVVAKVVAAVGGSAC